MRSLYVAVLLSLAAIGSAGAQPPPWAGPPGGYPPGRPPGYVPPPNYAPVPPPRNEFVPPPPGPRMVWEPGHWHWNGFEYMWISGRYVATRPHYRQYVPGRWAWRGGAWVWVPAHWI